MCEFEEKVKKNLLACGVSPDGSQKIGLAVSGGADSVSLLLALSSFLSSLYVITVNHNIRPALESDGDARFVSELCQKLEKENGKKINCTIIELPRGSVEAEAQKRGRGTEDAARSLRYEAFEKFISQNQLDALCLAHNRNDQLETILMRFLQGASFDSAGGIRARRGPYVRPLLNIARTEIESYLTGLGITWRTDKTNFETDYLRNKIRLKLLPFLDENFEGWQTAALKGAEKNAEDSEFIQSCLEAFKILQNADGSVELPLDDFINAPEAVKYRLLLEACNRAGESERIPHQFLKDVILCQAASFSKRFGSIEIRRKNNQLFIKKYSESNTDLVFSDIIEESGTFEFPFGNLLVFNYKEKNGKACVSVQAGENSLAENIPLPFFVRSFRPGDTILSADGSEKKVSDIYSDWHVPPEKRSLLPVIQMLDENPQSIKAILGGFLGYKDWIVKL
ncbi:tRNA lysidine(34) synthetase TilS [Treponema bryantii]|uniref:tRNA lysidine(34) synthetase TilS n=1 Tax=Treponema bryantii TaxID=163 RepID=UPI0003B4881C|nr:tRNA lysidine(34) synthetase TilS [Treponema bryantii]